eukprot:COSAG02_NODE_2175_length_9589_cov_6.644573_6_plen_136_part_00
MPQLPAAAQNQRNEFAINTAEDSPGPDPRLTEPFIYNEIEPEVAATLASLANATAEAEPEQQDAEPIICNGCDRPIRGEVHVFGNENDGFRTYCRPCGRDGDPEATGFAVRIFGFVYASGSEVTYYDTLELAQAT